MSDSVDSAEFMAAWAPANAGTAQADEDLLIAGLEHQVDQRHCVRCGAWHDRLDGHELRGDYVCRDCMRPHERHQLARLAARGMAPAHWAD